MNIAALLAERAALTPDAPAIIEHERGRRLVTTFGGLDDDAKRGAALLRRDGLRPGDTLLVFVPMSAPLYVLLTAAFRCGLTVMFLDPSAGREHIERCCRLRVPDAFAAVPRAHLLRLVSPSLRRIRRCYSVGGGALGARFWDVTACPPDGQIHEAGPDDPALLTFTSGSTGRPKAAVRTHGFLLAQHAALSRTLDPTPGAPDLATLPIFLLSNLASGVPSLIPDADLRAPGRIDAAPVLEQIRSEKPITGAASPAFFERLIAQSAAAGQPMESFQTLFTGGAPVFPRLMDALSNAAPNARVIAVYGSTEAEPIAHLDRDAITSEDRARMLGGGGLLAGPPVPSISVRILPDRWGTPIGPFTSDEFDGGCLSANAPGEIVVGGAHVLHGYLDGEGDSETKFDVAGTRRHRTGDAGYFDPSGRLWLLGRCSARLGTGANALYPFAVECAASGVPGVARTALVAVNDRRLLAAELTEPGDASPLAMLRETLAWARLDEIREVARIPVDTRHNAKVDYPALAKMMGSGGG